MVKKQNFDIEFIIACYHSHGLGRPYRAAALLDVSEVGLDGVSS